MVAAPLLEDHIACTRRYFLGLGLAGAIALSRSRVLSAAAPADACQCAIDRLSYLTPDEKFGNVERGKPIPSTLTGEARRNAGLDPATWRLEVDADPASNSRLGRPLTKKNGAALDWAGLLRLGERHAVRYLKVMTCNNLSGPLGMGLWEGVPLRDVLWLAQPQGNIRRVFFHGFHNGDPKQVFQSSLSINRVLEDGPGELPVLVCYKLNGQWLSPKRGGPVRMLVPEAYGYKSVKWLERVWLTNSHQANDTYALENNDVDSPLKTIARFVEAPPKARAGEPIAITGLAQVGAGGLSKTQYWLCLSSDPAPADDPTLLRGDWRDASLLPPPAKWGVNLPEGKLPPIPLQFDPATGKPLEWPLRYTIAHWAALLPAQKPGRYTLRCRAIDAKGNAQPMPRPLPQSGKNAIQAVALTVTPA